MEVRYEVLARLLVDGHQDVLCQAAPAHHGGVLALERGVVDLQCSQRVALGLQLRHQCLAGLLDAVQALVELLDEGLRQEGELVLAGGGARSELPQRTYEYVLDVFEVAH